MEKIILSNEKEMKISGISGNENQLEIRFEGTDFSLLESEFSDKEGLEKIILADSEGNAMSAFKNYAILRKITKEKDVIVDEINDTTADVITVTLEKEPDWMIEQRKLQALYDGAIMELGDTVSVQDGAITELAEVISGVVEGGGK